MFNRLDIYKGLPAIMEKTLAEMRAAKAEVEQQHHQELEIKNLTHCCSEQSSYTEELRGRVQKLEGELADSNERIKCLDVEVTSAIKANEAALNEARAERWSSEGLRVELETAKSDCQKARADADLAQGHIKYSASDQGKTEVVGVYRQSSDGKLEVVLAVKAGFDFLASRLPVKVQPSDNNPYPSLIYDCIHILATLEAQGAIIPLEPVPEDNEEEEEGEEGVGAAVQPLAEATTTDIPPPLDPQ